MIETVAAQPWVAERRGRHGRHLVLGDHPAVRRRDATTAPRRDHAALGDRRHVPDVLYPGGIFNTGFAVAWAEDRADDASPATTEDGGQGWARRRIDDGDETCRANQALRLQTPDVLAEIEANRFYDPDAVSTRVAPDLFVDQIDVPDVPRRLLAGRGDRWPLPEHARDFAPGIP